MALGLVQRAGLIFGLDLGPGSWKVLFPLFLAAVSSFQRREARSATRILRKEALILSAARRLSLSGILYPAASLAYARALTPSVAGAHLFIRVFPCS